MSISRAVALSIALLCPSAAANAAGPHGVDNGWVVDHASGRVLLTSQVAAQIAAGGTGWIRIEMNLLDASLGHAFWDDTLLALYDQAIDNARGAGLEVIMLIDGGSWRGRQSDWEQNSVERDGGDGDNPYVRQFAESAVAPLVSHFHDRVQFYELWNEPNAWTQAYGVGGSFLYPSNFSWLLARSWVAVHVDLAIADAVLFSGGVFGHSIHGVYSPDNAGAQYIHDTYATGVGAAGSFASVWSTYGVYPLDGIGQHFYIDQGGLTSSDHVQQYLDWIRQAYANWEGGDTPKKTFITEFGWTTDSVSQAVQRQNLETSFQVIDSLPYVQMATWFRWQDVDAPPLRYGVFEANGAPKAAFEAYRTYETFQGYFAPGVQQPDIAAYFDETGQPALGNPVDSGNGPWVYSLGGGFEQDYSGGSHTAVIVMTSAAGTFEVNDLHGFRSFLLTQGDVPSWGYAIDNEWATPDGTRQDFQNGYFTWDPVNGVAGHHGLRSSLP